MSGLEPLSAITRECCAVRFWAQQLRDAWDKRPEAREFTCYGCGRTYRKDSRGGWREVSAVELVKEIEGHHER